MSENLSIVEAKTIVLNNIFDILVETTGMHRGKYLDMHREEFLAVQLRTEGDNFASEYWFPATESDNMKLMFDRWRGFYVITQDRTAKGVLAAANADVRLKAMGYAS